MNREKQSPGPARLTAIILAGGALLLGGCGGLKSSSTGSSAATPGKAMQAHITGNTSNACYAIFDGTTGGLLQLKFKKLHITVKKKAPFRQVAPTFKTSKETLMT